MKKQISILLAITILVSAAGCGKTVPTEPSGQTTPKTEKQETAVCSYVNFFEGGVNPLFESLGLG